MLFINQWDQGEKIENFLETTENEHTTQTLWDTVSESIPEREVHSITGLSQKCRIRRCTLSPSCALTFYMTWTSHLFIQACFLAGNGDNITYLVYLMGWTKKNQMIYLEVSFRCNVQCNVNITFPGILINTGPRGWTSPDLISTITAQLYSVLDWNQWWNTLFV